LASIDYVGGATDLRGESRVDPENANLLDLAALRKVVLDGKCSDVCDVASNPDWVCADDNSHLVCHQGETKCISFHKHCLIHDDTCGPCADTGELERGSCDGQGECEIEEVEICHKKRTRCVGSESWLAYCYNHGDTCGACPSIIEEDEGDEDGGGDDGEDEGNEGNEGGDLDVSVCGNGNNRKGDDNPDDGDPDDESTTSDGSSNGNSGNGPPNTFNAGSDDSGNNGNGNGGSGNNVNGNGNPDDGDLDNESTGGGNGNGNSSNGPPNNSNAGGNGSGNGN
jgi:hypothetical protein